MNDKNIMNEHTYSVEKNRAVLLSIKRLKSNKPTI